MRKISLLMISILILLTNSYSQSKKEWFPSGLNVQPFAANFLEPRAGFFYLLCEKNIRLDIGTTSDIYKINYERSILTFGADLFTYTRLRSENSFKFPVEAIDYLFGINAAYKIKNRKTAYGFRFRFAHISAHLVDGSYDQANTSWRNGRNPLVYSREFFEIFPFYSIGSLRAYGGITYMFHVVPKEIGKGIYQVGFDYYYRNFPSKIFTPYIGYDFKLQKVGKYSGTNSITGGLKFGKWNKKGFTVSFSYISGTSVHGEYFDLNESYTTLGFSVEL